MSATAVGLVLVAALLHATWNALVKAVDDRAAILAAVASTHAVVGVVLLSTATWPAAASWPSIATSTLLHYGYYLLLFHSYRHGDLSQVYPVARGIAPALVAGSAAVLIGEQLTPIGWAGLALVTVGIGLLALLKGVGGTRPKGLGLALALGCSIAAYSVADGIGVRLSESPLGYMGWLFLLEAPVPLAIIASRRHNGIPLPRKILAIGFCGGLFAVVAYGLVLYVKTFAPLGAVSAVRESSVVFAALIGVVLFKERPWVARILAASVVAAGVIALAAAD